MYTLNLMVAAALTCGAVEVKVETLTGQRSQGQIVRLSNEEIVLDTPAGEQTFSPKQLLAIQPEKSTPPEAKPSVWVELVDGSLLMATSYSVDGGEAKLALLNESVVVLPTKSLAAVRFGEQDEALADQWQKIRRSDSQGDVIVVHSGDALEYLEGVLGKVTEERVDFEYDGDKIPVKLSKVAGMIYFHAAPMQLPETMCTINIAGGSRLSVASLRLEDDRLHVVGRAGLELVISLESIDRLDFSTGKIQYLSDLAPESIKWTPYVDLPETGASLGTFGQPALDRSLEGGPLLLAARNERGKWIKMEYEKGIALRSRSELVYRLPGEYRRFTATAGIDARVRNGGHVRLVISGDDKLLLDTEITGTDEPQPIDLNIEGVRRLRIVVDYGEDQDFSDHLDLCEARISK